ncbi:MAG: DUF4173 domain-containing protein [Clostridia bacterium]|nr:DUF4173 domain-containing protein [Clostridia bacterium]
MDNNFNAFGQIQEPQSQKREYSRLDAVIALLLFPLCYFIADLDIFSSLGRIAAFTLLFSITLIYMKKSGVNILQSKCSLALGISLLLLNFGIFFTANTAIRLTVLLISFFAFPYFVFAISGNSSEKYPSSLFPLELIKALFVMPFGSLGSSLEAISQNKKSGKIGKGILMVLLGLGIALIPCLIVIFLLSYDEGFNAMLDNILDFGFFDLPLVIKNIILAFPLALLLFGMLYSGKSRRFADILNEEKCKRANDVMGFAPTLLCVSAVIPFILIYLLFFVSQLDYYLSAFSGKLPEGMTYSSYAKNGFFQLCAVAVINFLIIICISIFGKKKDGEAPLALRIVNSVFSVATLVLIATAFSKMVIYIEAYGLTLLRVLPSAFMVFLAIVFVTVLIKQFVKKTNVVIVSLISAILICGILAFADVDGVIAKYNTDRYLAGELEHFEIGMLSDLGDMGIVQLDRITRESPDIDIRFKAEKHLDEAILYRSDDMGISLPAIRAEKIIEARKQ